MKELVVIPTHNGKEILRRCLDSISDLYPILVVDTCSDDIESKVFALNIKEFYPKLNIKGCAIPFKGYPTGAYLWAYWHYKADRYLFLQDSIEVQEVDYVKPFREAMPPLGMVAWTVFGMGYDSDTQKAWLDYMYTPNHPAMGVFGPIFYTSRESLDDLRDKQLLPSYPINKAQSQGMERGWPLAFHTAGQEIKAVYPMWNSGAMEAGTFGLFKKYFVKRG